MPQRAAACRAVPARSVCERAACLKGTRHTLTAHAQSPTDFSVPNGTLPGWLADKRATSRRAARPRTCPRCGAHTLVGPDHDTCAATARVDPQPADRITEIVALLRGRQSYDLIGANLYHREIEHIKAPRNPYPVLLEHECEKGTLW